MRTASSRHFLSGRLANLIILMLILMIWYLSRSDKSGLFPASNTAPDNVTVQMLRQAQERAATVISIGDEPDIPAYGVSAPDDFFPDAATVAIALRLPDQWQGLNFTTRASIDSDTVEGLLWSMDLPEQCPVSFASGMAVLTFRAANRSDLENLARSADFCISVLWPDTTLAATGLAIAGNDALFGQVAQQLEKASTFIPSARSVAPATNVKQPVSQTLVPGSEAHLAMNLYLLTAGLEPEPFLPLAPASYSGIMDRELIVDQPGRLEQVKQELIGRLTLILLSDTDLARNLAIMAALDVDAETILLPVDQISQLQIQEYHLNIGSIFASLINETSIAQQNPDNRRPMAQP